MTTPAPATVGDDDEEGRDMTAVLPEYPYVIEATEDDLRVALKNALARAGCTYDELAAQARTGRFDSIRARMAWVAIGDLGYLAG